MTVFAASGPTPAKKALWTRFPRFTELFISYVSMYAYTFLNLSTSSDIILEISSLFRVSC